MKTKFKFRSDFTIVLIVLLVTVAVFIFASQPASGTGSTKEDLKKHGQYYEYRMDLKLKIYVTADGTVVYNGRVVKDLSKLRSMVAAAMAEKVDTGDGSRVALIADKRVEYGIITKVLNQLRKAKVGKVFFAYQGHVSLLQAVKEINTIKAEKNG
jgi:biopolymer transport protein ExbD